MDVDLKQRLDRQRGQGTVEFVLFLIILTFSLFLLFAMTWIGVQKWQFNFFAAYAARTWSVRPDSSPESRLAAVQAAALVHHPDLATSSFVRLMYASSHSSGTPEVNKYTGYAPPFPLFKRSAIHSGGVNADIGENLLGMITFETSIPMEAEPDESTDKTDNDCSSYNLLTGKCSGNGR